MEPIGKDLARIVAETATSLAHARNLIATDGALVCWNCATLQKRTPELHAAPATLPTLHCAGCLDMHRRKSAGRYVRRTVNGIEYEYPTEPDEKYRWRHMLDNMRNDQRLNRESAARLLANAKALPGAFEGDMNELAAAFYKRFGHDDSVKSTRSVRWRDEAAE